MPRRARQESSTLIYHVVSRGINKEAIFKEKRERTRMINIIRENITKYDVEIYAYCIMPNHFHLLIRADLKELASFIAKILAKFAIYYNRKHNRVGYVFQGRYKSQCIEDLGYFWNCMRYIHKNPLRIEGAKSITNYGYSSMKELFYGKKDILSEAIFHIVEERFGDTKAFLEFHQFDSWDDFEDVMEEVTENRFRIARELLEDYEVSYQIEKIEILDYIDLKQEYKKELVILLGISVKEAERILESIRQNLKGTG